MSQAPVHLLMSVRKIDSKVIGLHHLGSSGCTHLSGGLMLNRLHMCRQQEAGPSTACRLGSPSKSEESTGGTLRPSIPTLESSALRNSTRIALAHNQTVQEGPINDGPDFFSEWNDMMRCDCDILWCILESAIVISIKRLNTCCKIFVNAQNFNMSMPDCMAMQSPTKAGK